MKLLLDIGNTHTSAALSTPHRVGKVTIFQTADWQNQRAMGHLKKIIGRTRVQQTIYCSVVPQAERAAKKACPATFIALNARNCGVPLDYPQPKTIGPDRLANARAVLEEFGGPVLVVDFGTAVTFDIVDRAGAYVGGVIAPGLSVMTDYLHEKTALLPAIQLKDHGTAIGKSTDQAMQIGAIHGYRGMVQKLIQEICASLKIRTMPVIATGGCARLIGRKVPEITAIRPRLTLDGLRLASNDWN